MTHDNIIKYLTLDVNQISVMFGKAVKNFILNYNQFLILMSDETSKLLNKFSYINMN